jgi:hypothetical protein
MSCASSGELLSIVGKQDRRGGCNKGLEPDCRVSRYRLGFARCHEQYIASIMARKSSRIVLEEGTPLQTENQSTEIRCGLPLAGR